MKYSKSRWRNVQVIALSLVSELMGGSIHSLFLCFILINESSFEGLLSLGAPSPVGQIWQI